MDNSTFSPLGSVYIMVPLFLSIFSIATCKTLPVIGLIGRKGEYVFFLSSLNEGKLLPLYFRIFLKF